MKGFKPIPGYENRYSINKHGDVFSHLSERLLTRSLNKSSGYFTVNLLRQGNQRLYRISQLVLLAFKGRRPVGLLGDHRNVTKTDDRLSNLRYVTHSSNMHNFVRKSRYGFRGVQLHKGNLARPWRAQLQINNRHLIGPYVASVEEAAELYDRWAIKHFGPTAITNRKLGKL